MDLVSAEPATSRRSLIGAFGIAGLASAAAIAVARPASAAPTDTEAPYSTSGADSGMLEPAMRLELAARRLYRDAAAALSDETAIMVAQVGAKNHEAVADRFAANTGISADASDEAFYEDNSAAFSTGDVAEFAAAAWALENNLVATYIDMFGDLESVQARTAVASIVPVNARMATVLTDLAGVFDDLDAVFEPPSEVITLSEAAS